MATKLKPTPHSAIHDMVKTLHEDTIVRLDGGAVLDVVAIKDDSDLRSWVLTVTGYPGIVGCTIVEGSDE